MTDSTRWWCRRCKRVLTAGKKPKYADSITATKGAQRATHDQCGGPVAWSKREGTA